MKTRSTFEKENLWRTRADGCRWRKVACAVPLMLAMFCGGAQWANAATIDFEGLSDSTPVASSYAGVTFENATVLTRDISLYAGEYPPRSGDNVAFDSGSPITVVFDNPFDSVGGYFTYASPLTLTVFDSTDPTTGNIIASVNSNPAFNANYVSSGNPPNELIQWNHSSGPYGQSITIEGDPAGGSFTLDDFFYQSVPGVPESSSAGLLLIVSLSSLVSLNWLLVRRKMVRQPAVR